MKDELDKKEEETVENEPLIEEEDDIVEFVYNADGEEDLKATLKKTRKDLKEVQKEKQDDKLLSLLTEKYLRLNKRFFIHNASPKIGRRPRPGKSVYWEWRRP